MVPNLTLIQAFYEVAHEGSYSAAARSLGLSYQSVTNHVRRLEQLVGDKLVVSEKGGKHIFLTPCGNAMYKMLDPELDIMLKRLSLVFGRERPLLRVGLPQAVFFYLFPQILQRFQRAHEGIELQALERDTMLPELIKDGALDVCISESFFGDPVVPQRLLGVYQLSLIVPQQWDVSLTADTIADSLKNRPFVTYEPGQTLRNVSIDFLSQVGVDPVVSVSTSGSSSVKRCVASGLGYSIIPSWCIYAEESLVQSLLLEDIPEIKLYFGHAQFLLENIYVKSLFDACQEIMPARTLDLPP